MMNTKKKRRNRVGIFKLKIHILTAAHTIRRFAI